MSAFTSIAKHQRHLIYYCLPLDFCLVCNHIVGPIRLHLCRGSQQKCSQYFLMVFSCSLKNIFNPLSNVSVTYKLFIQSYCVVHPVSLFSKSDFFGSTQYTTAAAQLFGLFLFCFVLLLYYRT